MFAPELVILGFPADYYALRAGALDSVVAMAHPDPGAGVARDAPSQSGRFFTWPSPASPLRRWTAGGGGVAPPLLPNCAFSRALALWRAALVASGQQIPLPLGGTLTKRQEDDTLAVAEAEPPSPGEGAIGGWLAINARRATRKAGLEIRGGGGDDALAADAAVASVMAAAVSSFCDKAHAASPDRAARLGVSAQLFSDPSAWSPIGAAARAVLLHPAAVLALLRELEISSTDTGTAHFGTDTRRGMGTDDADAAAREAPPEGIVVAGSEPAAGPAGRRTTERPNPKAIATSVHTVAWQALGRPDVDGCVWAELFSHPFFVLAEREQEASEGAGEAAGSGAAGGRRFDARMGRLVRVFVTRQAALWKDSDALAMLHRAALAAAAAWEAASDADTTGSSEARPVEPAMPAVRSAWLTDSSKREALLGAAFGTAEHAAVCVALADAARTAAYVAGSAALEPPAAPAAAATGAEPGWESIPPLAHYAGAIRAEFSDEVKEVSDEELRAAAGADLPTTGVAAGTGMAEAEAGALGSRLEQLAGQGARLQVGGQDGQLLDVDELLSRAAAMGLSPEELVTAMQTAQLSEHAPVAAAASGALPVDTDPIAAFFQSLLPWVSAPTPHDEAGQPAIVSPSGRVPGELPQPASPIMAPVSDADLAAHLQAAEDFGYLDGDGGDDADASTDDEA